MNSFFLNKIKQLLFLVLIMFSIMANAQDIIYWSGSSANGSWDWGNGCSSNVGGNWYWSNSGSGNRSRPDCYGGYNIIKFDNNSNSIMNLNSLSDFSANQILFLTGTSDRTINTDNARGIYFQNNNGNCKIENYVPVTTHTFNVPIFVNSGANSMEINPIKGYLSFTSTITNNSNNTINVYGNQQLTISGDLTGNPGVTINEAATVVYSGISKTYSGTTTINSGTKLRISSNQTLGNIALNGGTLQIDPGVTLTITGTYTATGGTINNLGTIKFAGGSVTFPGSASIHNGVANTMTNLEVASSGVVTLNSLLYVTGTITVSSGILALAGYNLHLNNANLNILSGATFDNGGENQIINDPNGAITVSGTFITRDADGFVGINTAIPSIIPTLNPGSTVEYGLNGNQAVQGLTAPTYQNITFSNGGTKTLVSKNTAIGTITISGATIFDASNNNFGSATSNVIMTGSSKYRLGGTIASKPESGGNYALGANTTFEFTGNSGTNIRLSAPIISYANIIVSGTNVSSPGAVKGINFQSGGTFTVKNGATFKLNTTAGFTGAINTAINSTNSPTVTLESGSTIEYAGADQSITLAPSNTAYSNLTVSGTGTKTIPSAELFLGNDLRVNAATLKIESGKTITVTNAVTVAAAATLAFESNDLTQSGSLVQINDSDTNSGAIRYDRTTTAIRNTDYTYWSAPVFDQTLLSVSPNTPLYKFFSYNPAIENWEQISSPSTHKMIVGKGYIFLGPKTYTSATFFKASFVGKPNNGAISIPMVFTGSANGTSNLIGNPYPSAIDADTFLDQNRNVLDGTIYFWTHNTSAQLASGFSDPSKAGSGTFAYTTDDYASYNKTGGTSATNGTGTKAPSGVAPFNTNIPNGNIAAGQAFFATAIANGNAIFNNGMRLKGGTSGTTNSQFFRNGSAKKTIVETVEKNRIWLDLTNEKGAFKQTLVGYIGGATNDYDNQYDGLSFDGNQYLDFYSINQDKNLVIQGRALPFDENDKVPLGFRTTISGDFSINIDQTDGLLTNQAVFIEDKVTNTIFDLRSGNYTFTTDSGIFNNRFVLRYTNATLGNPNFKTSENQIVIFKSNTQIKINSFAEKIEKVKVFDLLGKAIYQNNNVNSNALVIPDLASSQQMVLVKVSMRNGQAITKKIIF